MLNWIRGMMAADIVVQEVGHYKAQGIAECAQAFERYGETARGAREVDRICKKWGITQRERERVARRLSRLG